MRRQAQHARNPLLKDYKFEPVWRTDDYATQRGLEQILHDRTIAPLDKINPISPKNVKIDIYMQAARNFLRDY